MKSEFPVENCFLCFKKPVKFQSSSDSELNICHIIRQHFWFKEDDLQSAIVCEICWEKVDQFHQFYLDVQQLHGEPKATAPSVFIKQEEMEIEEDQLKEHCILGLALDEQKPFDIVDCKLEIPEECTELPKGELSQEPIRKKRKYSQRRPPNERIANRKTPAHYHRHLTPEERQAEDDFIRQHTLYFCEECNIEFESFLSFKRHQIKTHNKDSIECCGTQHRLRSFLYQHVRNVLNPEVFKCEICSRTFKYHSGYLRHKKEHHTDRKEPTFKCHRCAKSFAKETILKSHLKEHETLDSKTVKCEVCGKFFGHQRYLKTHIKTVHLKPNDFVCEVCSMGFVRRSLFLKHRKSHEPLAAADEPSKQQCPVCNKWLKKSSYPLHVQRHEDEGKEYKCEMCAHVSVSENALTMHIARRHAPRRKRHVCDLCGKEYSQATTLREHVANAHTGEPLYQCQFCDRPFFSNASMYAHRKKEHPQQWQQAQLAKYAAPADGRKEGPGEMVS